MYNLVPVQELLNSACFEMDGKSDDGLLFNVKTNLDVLFVPLLFPTNINDVKYISRKCSFLQ